MKVWKRCLYVLSNRSQLANGLILLDTMFWFVNFACQGLDKEKRGREGIALVVAGKMNRRVINHPVG
jgi:hypothetical protein